MFIWESQKHKGGRREASAKPNYTNKIIQSYPVILLFQPPVKKPCRFSCKFSLEILDKQIAINI